MEELSILVPYILRGLEITLTVTAVSLFSGLAMGLIIAVLRVYGGRVFSRILSHGFSISEYRRADKGAEGLPSRAIVPDASSYAQLVRLNHGLHRKTRDWGLALGASRARRRDNLSNGHA